MIGAAVLSTLAATAPVFAPPLGTPVRYTLRETRSNGDTPVTYEMVRAVTFRRTDAGFDADVVTLSAKATPDTDRADRFLAAASAFVGRTLRFRLDTTGRLIEVIDREREWFGWLDRLRDAMAREDPSALARIKPFLATLRQAPPEQQVETLAAHVTRIIGTAIVARGPVKPTPIRLPATGPTAPAELTGTESIARRTDGTLIYERLAQGRAGAGATSQTSLRSIVGARDGLTHETHEVTTYSLAGKTLTSERYTLIDY